MPARTPQRRIGRQSNLTTNHERSKLGPKATQNRGSKTGTNVVLLRSFTELALRCRAAVRALALARKADSGHGSITIRHCARGYAKAGHQFGEPGMRRGYGGAPCRPAESRTTPWRGSLLTTSRGESGAELRLIEFSLLSPWLLCLISLGYSGIFWNASLRQMGGSTSHHPRCVRGRL